MSAATTPDDEIAEAIFGLRHMALRNALYHTARYRFLDGVNRWFNFMVILGGTGTAAEIAKSNTGAATILGGGIAAIGALQLVFDYAGRAHRHEGLQRRYYEMLADIDCAARPGGDDCARWRADVSRIAADEPPTMRALDAIADNQATSALLGGDRPRMKVTWWQSITRQLLAHNGGKFDIDPYWKSAEELAADRETARGGD
nr:hypothetical protein [Brucella anthropi]